MATPFVWFDNRASDPESAQRFYTQMFGWQTAAKSPPGMTMFAGEDGPFAGVSAGDDAVRGWLPYVKVDDLGAATDKATSLGAEVVQARTTGPAGEFVVIHDPTGAALALWQAA